MFTGWGAALNQEREALVVEDAVDWVENSLEYELVRCLDSMRGIGSVLRPRCSSEEVLVREDPKAIVMFVKLKSCMWCIVEVIARLS